MSYLIAVFKPGTLWEENRGKLIQTITDQSPKLSKNPEFQKTFHIETRTDGRKVYFTMLGLGPGGGMKGAFTFFPDYDLLIGENFDAEDGVPKDQKIKNPISPTRDLSDFFKSAEDFITAGKTEPVQ